MANDPIKLITVPTLNEFKTKMENEIPDSVQYSTMPTTSADWVGKIVQYTGEDASGLGYDLINGHWYKCESWGTGYIWADLYTDNISNSSKPVISSAVSSALQTKQNIIQVAEMPTASSTRVGNILQYIGTTTASYTNGFFYKCVPGSTSGTYEWTPVAVQSDSPISSTSTTSPLTDSADGYVQGVTIYGRSEVVEGSIRSVGEGWGIVDLGTLNWETMSTSSGHKILRANFTGVNATDPIGNIPAPIICAKYRTVSSAYLYDNTDKLLIAYHTGLKNIWVSDINYIDKDPTEFKAAMSGVILCYQLADPTQSNTIAVKTDNGTGIDGTMATFTTALPLRGVSGTIRDKLICTAEKKQVETVCGEVDLGTLDWYYYPNESSFSTANQFVLQKKVNIGEMSPYICAKYTVVAAAYSSSWGSLADQTIFQYPTNNFIVIKDSNYTDATDLKNALSGVKLVYELAEPVTTPLTDAEISAFRGLKTYDSTTNVTITDEPEFEINYLKNTENGQAVANIQKDLQEQIDDLGGGSVQSDWNEADSTADDYIKNKPTLGTASALDVPASGDATNSQVVKGNDTRLSDARTPTNHASDKVTAMTGYSIAPLESAITTSDTLNSAIGKLEKGLQNRAKTDDYDITLTAAGWTGSAAPYTQLVGISGSVAITSTDKLIIDIVPSDVVQTGLDQIEQFSYISKAVTGNNSVTFYCYEDKPDIDLPISIKVVK